MDPTLVRGTVTAPGRPKLALAMAVVLLAACAQGGTSGGEPPELRATIVACTAGESGGSIHMLVRFEATPHMPPGIAALIPRLRLDGYRYRRSSDTHGEGTEVPPFAPPSPTDDGVGVQGSGARAPSPPPTAEITFEGEPPPGLIFDHLTLASNAETMIRADGLGALEGRSAGTPLGQATVSEVKLDERSATITVFYDWMDGLGPSSPFQPTASFTPDLGPGGLLLSFRDYVGGGPTRWSQFRVPVDRQDDPVALRFGGFAIFHSAPVRLAGIEAACA